MSIASSSIRTCLVIAVCSIAPVVFGACGDDGETNAGGSGSGGAGSASSSATVTNGVECGTETCDPSTQFCGFAPGTCEGPRTCQLYPECGEEKLVCSCNGQNYEETCIALELGGGATEGGCPPPAGQFTCSYEYQIPIYCDLASEYCKVTPTGGRYDLDCVPLPAACDEEIPDDCSCTGDSCADNYCGVDEANGAITVLCPLPG